MQHHTPEAVQLPAASGRDLPVHGVRQAAAEVPRHNPQSDLQSDKEAQGRVGPGQNILARTRFSHEGVEEGFRGKRQEQQPAQDEVREG